MPVSQRYFTLFGSRATGKTVFLASFYGSSGDEADGGLAYHVAASEEPNDLTHSYLSRIGRAMRAGRWPDPSEYERPTRLRIQFTMGQLARELVLPDVSGEMTQIGENQYQPELKKEILTEYKDYHGYLIFVPADVTDPELTNESKWEVDSLLTALRERVPEGRTQIARPIAILVTKWDLIEPGPLTGSSEAECVMFLEGIHPDLIAGLRTLCENVRIFPVSATGPLVDGRPAIPLRPTNLGEPIVWLVETAERVMLERTLAYVEENRPRFFRRVPGDEQQRTYRKIALERLHHFLEEMPHGPLAEAARRQIEELRAIARRRFWRSVRIGVMIAIAVGFAVSGVRDARAYRRAHDLIDRKSSEISPGDVIARVNAVLSEPFSLHPVGYALNWWRTLEHDLKSYRTEYENQSFEALQRSGSSLAPNDEQATRELLDRIESFQKDFPKSEHLAVVEEFRDQSRKSLLRIDEYRRFTQITEDNLQYKTHPTDSGLANQLLSECEIFVKDYPGSPQLASVQAIGAYVRANISTMERTKNYEDLRLQLSKAAESPIRCYELCLQFLKNDSSHPRAQEVEIDRDRFLKRADDKAWNEVVSFARDYTTLFPDQIRRCEDYLDNALYKAHQGEAVEFKKRAIRGHDRSQYGVIWKRAQEGSHPDTLKAVNDLCEKYLAASIPDRRMTTETEAWSNWFKGWAKGKSFKVRVTTVRIERGSAWHHRFSIPDPWVHASVQVGSKTASTIAKSISLDRDERDLADNLLGPFTWKWGDPEVVISVHHKDASPPTLATRFDERDSFPVRHLDGLTKFDGGKIAVRLECPDVIPPALPPYKD